MADPLSIAASLIAVVQVSSSIINACYDYRRGVKGAKKEVGRMLSEAQGLRNVVEQLLHMVQPDDDETPDDESDDGAVDTEKPQRPSPLPVLKQLISADNGPVTHCLSELQAIEKKLLRPMLLWKGQQQDGSVATVPRSPKVLGLAQVLLWPLREREMLDSLEMIQRLRGLISLALSADTASTVLAIHETTQSIRASQALQEMQIAQVAARDIESQRAARRAQQSERVQMLCKAISGWLSPIPVAARHKQMSSCRSKDTGRWLLDTKDFQAWARPEAAAVEVPSFWMHGIPGSGKTVLASNVIDHLQSAPGADADPLGSKDVAIAYFYFDFGNTAMSRTDNMLRLLLCQLGLRRTRKGSPYILQPLYDMACRHLGTGEQSHLFQSSSCDPHDSSDTGLGHLDHRIESTSSLQWIRRNDTMPTPHGEPSQPSTEELLGTLRDCIRELQQSKPQGHDVFIILDALDECSDREELLQCLGEMLAWHQNKLASEDCGSFRIFLTSRHIPDIAQFLDGYDQKSVASGSLRSCCLSSDLVQGDIKTFVQSQLASNPRLRRWPPELRKEIQTSLTDGARGMFRWADCQLAMLQKCATVRAIRKALASLPQSLSETYAQTLLGIEPFYRLYAVRILLWAAVSTKPLELNAAADFLAVEVDDVEDGHYFDEENRVPDIHEIALLCTSLVKATPGGTPTFPDNETGIELSLAHYTVQEYVLSDLFFTGFLGSCAEDLPPSIHDITTPALAHAYTARTMLHYLLSLRDPLTQDVLASRHLARHAAESWPYHYKEAGKNGQDILQPFVNALFGSSGADSANEPYNNWCRLHDATMAWRPPQLDRAVFPPPLYTACILGLDAVVDLLLAAGADPDAGGDIHKSCVQAAAFSGHLYIVRSLLAAGADPCRGGGLFHTPLVAATAANHGDIVAELLKHKDIKPDEPSFATSATALLRACQDNRVEIVKRLVAAGADTNRFHMKSAESNPFCTACRRGHLECVAVMLPVTTFDTIERFFKSINHASHTLPPGLDEPTAMALITLIGTTTSIHRLRYSMSKNLMKVASPLMMRQFREQILSHKMITLTPSRADEQGQESTNTNAALQSPIPSSGNDLEFLRACENRQFDLAKQLLAGGHVNARGALCERDGELIFPLLAAVEGRNLELARLRLEQGADVRLGSFRHGPPLTRAAYNGDLNMVRLLVEEGKADVNLATSQHGTALQSAVAVGDLPTVDYLLQHGAQTDLVPGDDNGYRLVNYCPGDSYPHQRHAFYTPLQIAIVGSRLRIVKRLLEAGADPNQVPLERKWVPSLITSGDCFTNTFTFVPYRQTPLSLASEDGNAETIRLLLSAGADPLEKQRLLINELPHSIEPALHQIIARELSLEPAIALIRGGIDPNEVVHNTNGVSIHTTHLATLCRYIGQVDTVDTRLDGHKQASHVDKSSVALILIEALLSAGADPTKSSVLKEHHEPPLHTLVRVAGPNTAHVVAAMRAFLTHTAVDVDIDAADASGEGWTALHIAVRYGRADLVAALLDGFEMPNGAIKRANPAVALRNGSTALHYAVSENQLSCLEELARVKDGRLPCMQLNQQDALGWTPLHWAVHDGSSDVVAWLLKQDGIDITIQDPGTGMTVRDFAILRLQDSRWFAEEQPGGREPSELGTGLAPTQHEEWQRRQAVLEMIDEHLKAEA